MASSYIEGLDTEEVEEFENGAGEEDDIIDVDFTNVGVVPPKGKYLAVVTSSKKMVSQAGNPMVVLGFTIQAPEQYAGVYVSSNLMLAGAGLARTKEAFEAFGLPSRTPTSAFKGRKVILELSPQSSERYGPQAQVLHYHKA